MPGINTSRASIFVAGNTGQVGHALVAQLATQESATHEMIRVVGTANTRWLQAPGQGPRPRHAGDWNYTLDVLRQAPYPLFIDCTASEEVAALYPQCLEQGIGIITPNKLAFSGPYSEYRQLHALADAKLAPLLYETTVGAALPILSTVRDLVARGEQIEQVEAVLSGTLSFVFARVNAGATFAQAVREARDRGYTEPHPGQDLAGTDTLRKLLILLRCAGLSVEADDITLAKILPDALIKESDPEAFLRELASLEKRKPLSTGVPLACIARYGSGVASISVGEVISDSPFARLAPGANLVRIHTDRYRELPLTIAGPGAGAVLTAGGLISDLMRVVYAQRGQVITSLTSPAERWLETDPAQPLLRHRCHNKTYP